MWLSPEAKSSTMLLDSPVSRNMRAKINLFSLQVFQDHTLLQQQKHRLRQGVKRRQRNKSIAILIYGICIERQREEAETCPLRVLWARSQGRSHWDKGRAVRRWRNFLEPLYIKVTSSQNLSQLLVNLSIKYYLTRYRREQNWVKQCNQ